MTTITWILRNIFARFVGSPAVWHSVFCTLVLFVLVPSAVGQNVAKHDPLPTDKVGVLWNFKKLYPTELFFRRDGRLYQAVLTDIPPTTCKVARVKDAAGINNYATDSLTRFMGKLVIPVVPDDKSQRVEISLDCNGPHEHGPSASIDLEPARRWRVHIIPHTHLDIGYTDLQENVWRDLAENLDGVIDLCKKNSGLAPGLAISLDNRAIVAFREFCKTIPPTTGRRTGRIDSRRTHRTGRLLGQLAHRVSRSGRSREGQHIQRVESLKNTGLQSTR